VTPFRCRERPLGSDRLKVVRSATDAVVVPNFDLGFAKTIGWAAVVGVFAAALRVF
jgi:hypothetical protein